MRGGEKRGRSHGEGENGPKADTREGKVDGTYLRAGSSLNNIGGARTRNGMEQFC